MNWISEKLNRFRLLPTPLLTTVVAAKFLFGFGLGAVLARRTRANWTVIGAIAMALATAMALPIARQILSTKPPEE